jgi:hypothetical protein
MLQHVAPLAFAFFVLSPASGGSMPKTQETAKDSSAIQILAADLDRASVELDALAQRVQGSFAEVAVRAYMREFSRFHVGLGRLRPRREDQLFLLGVKRTLQVHMTRLELMVQEAPREMRGQMNEALNHVRSAQEIVVHFDPQSKTPVFQIRGATPDETSNTQTKRPR